MKKYTKPSLEKYELEAVDVITVSGGPSFIKGKGATTPQGSVNWDEFWNI